MAKAFDTASHCTIDRALKRFNIDSRTRNYILNTYCDSSTIISCEKVTISDVMTTRGVKQGDPLSPLLFNMIIDELLDLLPDQIGAKIYGERCNSLAFAGDLILIANDENCARELLKLTTNFFAERSMKINGKKCFRLIEPGNVTQRQISHLCCNPKIFYRRTTDYSDHRDKLL